MKACVCEVCGKSYEISTGEFNRKIKRGTSFFCSLSCAGTKPRHNPHSSSQKNKEHLRSISGNQQDELSPFRELAKRARLRSKSKRHQDRGLTCTITPAYLKEVWEEQEGKCAWTKLPLVLPLTTRKEDRSNPNLLASLDRKDSSLGYVEGNVQFVCVPLNLAKREGDDATIINLIQLIREGA